jgi:hypothetical protein
MKSTRSLKGKLMTHFTKEQHARWLELEQAKIAKFARVAADCRREDERDTAYHAVQVECGNCQGTGLGWLFAACISCGGSGMTEDEE